MTQLDISGGTLPAGMVLRESPTLKSLGRATKRLINGGYRISSFHNIYLEISLNNGATTVALTQPRSYDVVLQPGLNLIANHLDHGSNKLYEVLPEVPDGTTFFKWDNASHGPGPVQSFIAGGGWFDNSTGNPSTVTFSPGEAAFINNPNSTPFTITFTGTSHEPSIVEVLDNSNLLGLSQQTASVGSYDSITGKSPAEGSQMIHYNPVTQSYQTNRFTGGAWTPANQLANIGEGVLVVGPANTVGCLTIACPADIHVTSPDGNPVNVPFGVTVSSYCGSAPVVTLEPPPPGPFPVGTTTVNCFVANDLGTASCSFKVIVAPPTPVRLTVTRSGTQIVLHWSGLGTLQAADNVAGPYIDIDPAPTSPYTIVPSALVKQQFYRLRQGQPPFTFYDTEMLQLDISGGNLPQNMKLRESPTLASTGKTAIQPQANGQYIISSYFDVNTEVSMDNGQTWSVSTSAPPHMSLVGTFQANTLPPTNSTYVSPDQWHALYASGIEVTNADHLNFVGSFPPPPPGGVTATHTFSSTAQMVVKLCPTCPFTLITAPATTKVQMKSR